MKSIKTVWVLSALLMVLAVGFFCLPARSAGSLILYVRNQVYTEPTVKVNDDLYASLSGLLKALRFGWKIEGSTLTILPTAHGGPVLTSQTYTLFYRGRKLNVPMRYENSTTWVSVSALANAVGAGFQTNPTLNLAEVYFVAAAPVAAATPAATESSPAAAPAASSSSAPSPAPSGSASPDAAAAAPSPSPTPQPDVIVTRSIVTPDMTNGRLIVTIDVENPADIPAKDVNVHVDVLSGEGDALFSENVYIGTMDPHKTVTKIFNGAHPSGTSMPHSLYHADTNVTQTH